MSSTPAADRRLIAGTPSDREILIRRVFAAPPERVYDALLTPELVRRWLLGPPGGSMPVCEIDPREGGSYRYVWRNQDGSEMSVAGTFRELDRPRRVVHTERFDPPWYPGDALVTTELTATDGGTLMTVTVRYDTQEARDQVLASPMEQGLGASYDRLDALLA
ncbi:SRPBCC family protein [Geminicoccus roseus]|uniref:SRPBCC family protein n=1 Tax=Geminicoccus roseus TaxID=404900 RepID=UPI0004005CE7|nr:SRPBCC family protein [Geminicoccus roseus]